MDLEKAVTGLYDRLIGAWNAADAAGMASLISKDGLVIGFDGSQMTGREEVAEELGRIFGDHTPAKYVTKVRSVHELQSGAAVLHAVAGMPSRDGSALMPDRNSIQVVVAHQEDGEWKVALFQNTPARFDGRPDLASALTGELTELL
jgi:uncharacterized protein (TIGR02246 family)